MADHYGRKIFIIFGLLGFSVANLLYAQANSFEELFFFRIVEGSSAAAIGPIVNAMVIDIIPEKRRGRYLGLVNGSGFMGNIIGPFLGGILVQGGNYQLPFEMSAFIAIIGMVFALLILPNDYGSFKNVTKEKNHNKRKIFKELNINNWVIEGTTFVFIVFIFIRFAGIVSWSLIEPSVSFYLYNLNYDSLAVGFYFSCYGITMFLGQTFLGGLSDKFGRKIVLQIGLIIYMLGFCFLLNTDQIINFYISGILNGIGVSLIIPSIVAELADITNGSGNRGKIMGFYYGAYYLAGIVGPIFGGYLGEVFNFNFVVSLAIAILIMGWLSCFLIKVKKEKKTNLISKQALTVA